MFKRFRPTFLNFKHALDGSKGPKACSNGFESLVYISTSWLLVLKSPAALLAFEAALAVSEAVFKSLSVRYAFITFWVPGHLRRPDRPGVLQGFRCSRQHPAPRSILYLKPLDCDSRGLEPLLQQHPAVLR